jgi:hypothetical protein
MTNFFLSQARRWVGRVVDLKFAITNIWHEYIQTYIILMYAYAWLSHIKSYILIHEIIILMKRLSLIETSSFVSFPVADACQRKLVNIIATTYTGTDSSTL